MVAKKKSAAAGSAELEKLRRENLALRRRALVLERLRFERVAKRRAPRGIDGELLAAGVAHEFNNILGAIDGHAEWALETNNASDMREALQLTRTACARSAQITRALQGLVQPREEEKEWLALPALVQELAELQDAWLRARDVQLRVDALDDITVYASASQLLEILVNLVKNAAEALLDRPAPREIRIASQLRAGRVTVSVSDNGPGVNASMRELIFRPFFTTKGVLRRVSAASELRGSNALPTSATAGPGSPPPTSAIESTMESPVSAGATSLASNELTAGGSGLGLFFSRALAEEMGGELNFAPPRKGGAGQGARFELSLPLAAAEKSPKPRSKKSKVSARRVVRPKKQTQHTKRK